MMPKRSKQSDPDDVLISINQRKLNKNIKEFSKNIEDKILRINLFSLMTQNKKFLFHAIKISID